MDARYGLLSSGASLKRAYVLSKARSPLIPELPVRRIAQRTATNGISVSLARPLVAPAFCPCPVPR